MKTNPDDAERRLSSHEDGAGAADVGAESVGPALTEACHAADLDGYRRNVTSQSGEDGVIEEIFARIGVTNRWCVELGAADGLYVSNTWNLVNHREWRAVYLEGDATKFTSLAARYAGDERVHAVRAFVSHDGPASLDHLLAATPIPGQFDLLSLDIDGNEYHVWKSMTRYRPRVVVVEVNATMPPEVKYVGPPGNRDIGSSARAMVALANDLGYEMVAHVGVNCVFVSADEYPKLGLTDNTLERLFDHKHLIHLMSTYDGRPFTARKPPWGYHGAAVGRLGDGSRWRLVGRLLKLAASLAWTGKHESKLERTAQLLTGFEHDGQAKPLQAGVFYTLRPRK